MSINNHVSSLSKVCIHLRVLTRKTFCLKTVTRLRRSLYGSRTTTLQLCIRYASIFDSVP